MITQRSSAWTVQVMLRISIELPRRTPTPDNHSTSSDIRLLPAAHCLRATPLRMNLRHAAGCQPHRGHRHFRWGKAPPLQADELRTAYSAAWVRSATPSLASTELTCVFTVFSDMCSKRAIS